MIIKDWVTKTFDTPGPKLFLELGAHVGEDTEWMARIPGVTIHAFEPDPRNKLSGDYPNVFFHPLAISRTSGTADLFLSQKWDEKPWTCSSSLHAPTDAHYKRWPAITFDGVASVQTISLDDFYTGFALDTIDFIWCDIQGAEGDMIRGGETALAHSRYLYTEYSDAREFENQITLAEILKLLGAWSIIYQWPDDVLLKNQLPVY
jgi:2-O-methyltransferase